MRVGQWPMVTAPQRSKCWKRSWSHLSDQPSRSSAHSLSDSLQPPYPEYLQHEKGGGLEQSKVDFTVCTYLCWSPAVYVLLWSQGSNTCKSRSRETWFQPLILIFFTNFVFFVEVSSTCSLATHLSSCQFLPRAPPSGHRGSELWGEKHGIWSIIGPRWPRMRES